MKTENKKNKSSVVSYTIPNIEIREQIKKDVALWLKQYQDRFTTFKNEVLNIDEYKHVLNQLTKLKWSYVDSKVLNSLGSFLTAITKNQFEKAVNYADGINLKHIEIYAKFLYNYMPFDWKTKFNEV